MNLDDDEQTFLRDLVKSSRQKIHLVEWVDRDGTKRFSTLSAPEAVRLNQIAAKLRVSKSETLRVAAHVPVKKAEPKPGSAPTE